MQMVCQWNLWIETSERRCMRLSENVCYNKKVMRLQIVGFGRMCYSGITMMKSIGESSQEQEHHNEPWCLCWINEAGTTDGPIKQLGGSEKEELAEKEAFWKIKRSEVSRWHWVLLNALVFSNKNNETRCRRLTKMRTIYHALRFVFALKIK